MTFNKAMSALAEILYVLGILYIIEPLYNFGAGILVLTKLLAIESRSNVLAVLIKT